MDNSKSVTTPPPPPGVAARTNLSQNHHHHPMNENNNGGFPFTSILLIAIPIIIVILLFVVSLLLVMLRRLQYSCKSYCSCKYAASSSRSCNSPNAMPANSSPEYIDENGGCLHSVSSRRGMPLETKLKGVQVFTYKEMEIATNRFSKENVIGNGGYGVVYKGTLSNGSMAAIKVLHREGKLGERAFRLEVDLLSRLRSPHLVELIGYCADQHYRLLIFEYLPNGSLHNLLHTTCSDNRQISVGLNWGMRLRIALDCAKALEYLHEYTSPSVIHRDFKTSNILLDHDFRARVSDFGLAKIGSDKINGLVSTRVLGTTGYLAPEYASTGKLTTKSDVYSYGIVLLELLTGRVPIDTKRPSGEHVLVSWAMPRLTNREKVVEMVDPAIKDQYSKKELIQVAAIAAMCVQTEPDYRPLMTDVVQSMIPLVKNLLSTGHPLGSYRDNNQRASPTNGNRIRPSNTGQRTS